LANRADKPKIALKEDRRSGLDVTNPQGGEGKSVEGN